ncbi:hypothetical protein GBA52_025129 [Prunus armeniaca]|nr:hypothetical protein GBA52_025129 [Prunus armeniaca]
MTFITNALYKMMVSKSSSVNKSTIENLNKLPHFSVTSVEDMHKVVKVKTCSMWTESNKVTIDGDLDPKEHEQIVVIAEQNQLQIIPFSLGLFNHKRN